jgi:hypothetical protein
MRAVYALYPDGHAAQQAVDGLRAAGLADAEITICSPQPMEDFEFGNIDKKSWMWWIACGGAAVGASAALGLAWLTETSWPIDVGGLPTWAWWPNLIITFELTMLGAIVATVITLVITAGFGRQKGRLYDPEVSDGKILVGVENPRDASLSAFESALTAPPGAELRRK